MANKQLNSSLYWKSIHCIIQMMLHLGWTLENLLAVRIGTPPTAIGSYQYPIFDVHNRCLFWMPANYLGVDKEYLPPTTEGDDQAYEDFIRSRAIHDQVYESIEYIHRIDLPPALRTNLREMLAVRGQAIRRAKSGKAPNALFLVENEKGLVPMTGEHVRGALRLLTQEIRKRIPDFPNLRETHFLRTGSARLNKEGVRLEHLFHISDRLPYGSELENRYSLVSHSCLTNSYTAASTRFAREYMPKEDLELTIHPLPPVRYWPIGKNRDHDLLQGSGKVIRLELLQDIIAKQLAVVEHPEEYSDELPVPLARHNAWTHLAILSLGALNGIRHFELTRLRSRDLDAGQGWLAIRGKPHVGRPAYRCLPVLPEIVKMINHVSPPKERSEHPNRPLFFLHLPGRSRSTVTPRAMGKNLYELCLRVGRTAAPCFYSLRHRFRTDWLAYGVEERMINYMMGHESCGCEPHSIYQSQSLSGLQGTYREAASDLGREYGWRLP